MSCKMEDGLTAYLDGELEPEEVARVRAHLAGCDRCRATEALLRRTLSALSELPTFEPSVGLRRRVLDRVEALPGSAADRLRSLLRPAWFLPSAVGLLAAGVAAVLLVRGPGAGGLPPELVGPGLEVAMNFDLATDYEVLGLESPDDLEVVADLQELEGRP